MQNSEKIIMKAYVWHLYSNGETKEGAEEIASQYINRFKKAESDEIRAAEGHNDSIPADQLADHVADKYLAGISVFIKEAQGKKNLHDLEFWWQKHQNRASMNLLEDEFNRLAMEVVPRLRANFESNNQKTGNKIVTPEPEHTQETQQDCTALVVDIRPDDLTINDNFSRYADAWRAEMLKADFIPQDEAALKVIRANEKKCKEVEKAIDDILGEISTHLEEIGRTDPKIKAYTDKLVDNRKKLNALKEETIAHRKNISHAPKRYMADQKDKTVKEYHARVNDAANQLFVGEIAKGRNDAGARDRLVAAYKGKRTVDTIRSAVEEEAGRIIEELNDRAALCRSNLELIAASGRSTLFQDQDSLMTWGQDRLEQEIKLRVSQDDLLKAQAVRKPGKLEKWKQHVDGIDNIPQLKNWYKAYLPEIESDLPHEDDLAILLEYCGARNKQLATEVAKSMNNPPPPEDDGPANLTGNGSHQCDDDPVRKSEKLAAEQQNYDEAGALQDEEPEEFTLQLEFKVFCTVSQAKKIGTDAYTMIGSNPMVQEDTITLRKI